METDPSIIDITSSLGFLFLHGISVPLQIPIHSVIDVILVDDTKMTQSIIGEVEDLGIPGMCPHEVVCYDGDEALWIIAHPIRDVLLHNFIELTSPIKHQIQWFHFLFILSIRKTYPYIPFINDLGDVEVLLGSFLIHPFLVHISFHGVIISGCISKE